MSQIIANSLIFFFSLFHFNLRSDAAADPEVAKGILKTIAEEAKQLVEDTKNAMEESPENAEVFQSVHENANRVVANAESAIEGIANGESDGVKTTLDSALDLVEEAQNAIVNGATKVGGKYTETVQGGGNILHKAIDLLGGGAKKVLETSGKINNGVHNFIGNALSSVSGGAHAAVDKITSILTWGKKKVQSSSSA